MLLLRFIDGRSKMRRRIPPEQSQPPCAFRAGARRGAWEPPGRCPGVRHSQDGDCRERRMDSLAVGLFHQDNKTQTNPVLPLDSLEELEK